jgi:hypothetical protein
MYFKKESQTVYLFVCPVRFSQQTAIIPLDNIKWLVFVMEAGCVYSEVRNGILCYSDEFERISTS